MKPADPTAKAVASTPDVHEPFTGFDSLRPSKDSPVEWWYYNGHLRSGDDTFSFHMALFRFSAKGFRIGRWIPVSLLGDEVGFGHVSLTDHQSRRTHFCQRRAFGWRTGTGRPCLDLRLKDLLLWADSTEHHLKVNADCCSMDLVLQPNKPIVSYGPGGLFESELPRQSQHVSCPRMSVTGSILVDGGRERQVEGFAWMDREYGQIGPDEFVEGWVWMSIQLDEGHELMIYQLQRRDCADVCLKAAVISQDGDVQVVDHRHVQIEATRFCKSPKTEARYPVDWSVVVEAPGQSDPMKLNITSEFESREFDTRGTTCTVYWEGPAIVSGTIGDQRVAGRAFMELVGFEDNPLFGQIDHARRNLPLLGYLANEIMRLLVSDSQTIEHG